MINKIEAREWAEVLSAYLEKAVRGEATFADADGIVLDLVEAIGREAEEGGWYADWADMMGFTDPDEDGAGPLEKTWTISTIEERRFEDG